MSKEKYNFTYPINFPIHFVNMLKENGADISNEEIKMVIDAVKYDIARKFEISDQGIIALGSIMKALKKETEEKERKQLKSRLKIL